MSFDSTMVGLVVFSIVMHSSVQLFAERFYGLAYSSSPCRAIFLAVPLPTLTGCFILSVHYVPFCRRIRCPGLSMTWFYIMNILVLMYQIDVHLWASAGVPTTLPMLVTLVLCLSAGM